MESIVAVSDLTPDSDEAIRLAGELGAVAGAVTHVVHALGLIGSTLREVFDPLERGVLRKARAALEEQVERVRPSGERPSLTVDYQTLPRAIATAARERAAELIVVSAAGPKAIHSIRSAVFAAKRDLARPAAVLAVSARVVWPPRRVEPLAETAVEPLVHWLQRLGAAPLAEPAAAGDASGPLGSRPPTVETHDSVADRRRPDLCVVPLADWPLLAYGEDRITASLPDPNASFLLVPPTSCGPTAFLEGGRRRAIRAPGSLQEPLRT